MKLVEHSCLCADLITMADLVVFNEISMFMELNEYTHDDTELTDFRNFMIWYKKMLNQKVIGQVNDRFK